MAVSLDKKKVVMAIVLIAVTAAFIVLSRITEIIVHWHWMGELDYPQVFWRLFWVKTELYVVPFAVILIYLWINLWIVLKRVIAVYGKRVVMAPTIEEAVGAAFGKQLIRRETPSLERDAPEQRSQDKFDRIIEEVRRMNEALKRGDWSEFENRLTS